MTAAAHRARWVVPADGSPLEDGAVVAVGGRIARLGPWSRVRAHLDAADAVTDHADTALLPGFVNAHTHLAYSDMAGRFRPTRDFLGWLGGITVRRMARTTAAGRRAVTDGVRLSLAAGTVAAADLTPEPHQAAPLAASPARWTVYGEVFRHGQDGLDRLADAVDRLEHLAAETGLGVGLSPHAPYTVGVEVYRACRREADRRGWPLSTHLHETPEELAMAERGEGPLVPWLRRFRVLPRDWRPLGQRPIPALAEAGLFSGPVLVAHANYLTDAEVAILAEGRATIAFCPRSHAFFGHEDHPWRRLRAAGVTVCLGTDSLASCPSLSMLDEARFLAERAPDLSPRDLLRMITADGAAALGHADTGALRPGLRADLAAVGPVPPGGDPLAAVFGGAGAVRATVVAGTVAFAS